MTDLKPCPCCGRKLSWGDVVELDEEGCPTHYYVDVVTVLLNCDCGFNMIIPADLIDYPMAGWEDRFKERANKRVDAPRKMCANCKHHRITGEFGVFLCSYMCDKTGEDDWSNTYCGVCDNWESE